LLHALNAAAVSIQKSARSEKEVLQAFSDNVSRLGLLGFVCLFDENREFLVIRSSGQPGDALTQMDRITGMVANGLRFHLHGTPFQEKLIERGESIFVEDWVRIFEPFFDQKRREFITSLLRGMPGYHGIFSPLRTSDGVGGILAIFTLGLSEQDILVVEAFANHVAIALENAALFEDLEQAETRYRSLFESSNDGIAIFDPNPLRLLSVNKKMVEMIGYSLRELQTITMSQLTPASFMPEVARIYESIRTTGHASFELPLTRKDSTTFTAHCTGGFFDAGGQTLLQFRIEDLSSFKQMETALMESEERFRTFFQQASDGIMMSDEHGIIIEWNDSQELITGIKREDAVGKYIWDVQFSLVIESKRTPEYYEQMKRFGQLFLQTGGKNLDMINPVVHQIKTPDGSIRDLQIVGFPVRTSRGYRSGSITRDIHETRHLEQALRRRVEALKTLHDFSLDVTSTHDLPSLLTTIVERAVHLLEASGGALYTCDPDQKQIVCVVSYNTTRDYTDVILKYGEGAAGSVAETGTPLLVNDYGNWEGRVQLQHEKLRTSAVISVPLLTDGQTIGVLQLMHEDSPREFTESDQELLTLFADQAVIAIGNTRLLLAEKEAHNQAETLEDVAQAVSSTLDLKEVLSVIIHQLARLLQFDISSVLLYGDQGESSMAVGVGYPNEDYIHPKLGEMLKDSQILARMKEDLQPVYIADVHQDPDWILLPGTEKIRSFMGIPIIARKQMIGTLFVSSYEPDHFSERDLNVSQSLAQHMAMAIVNARLYKDQEQRAAELQAVHQASLSVTSSLELEGVLYAILSSTLALLPDSQNSHIFLYHAEEDALIFGAALWEDGSRRGEPLSVPRKTGLTYNVARSGQMIAVPDMHTHPLYTEAISQHPDWAGSIVGLPLKIGQQVVGVMNVAYKQPRHFPETELRILRLLGDQAAIAIENAHLYEQAAGERRHISLLFDISRVLSASLDPDTILNDAIRLTQEALGGLMGEAYLYEPHQQSLSLRAIHGREIGDLEVFNQEIQLKPGKGLSGWVLENDQPVLVADVMSDPRWLHFERTDYDARAAIACPIPGEVRPVGVLMVIHAQPGYFTYDQLELLQGICQQVGLALANAQRYQQVQDLVNMLAGEQDRLVGLIEGLPVGVALLDAEHYLMIANSPARQFLAAFGITEALPKIDRLGEVTLAELVERQNDPVPYEIIIDGPPQRVFTAQVRQVSPGRTQWVLIIGDITRERESQMRAQMQERLATVGQLAAGIAHDFNNIMAAILVYSDLLMQDMSLYPAGRERLNIIRQQVQRAASLIRQILDFSRRSVMEQTIVDLTPFIKELHKLLRRVLPESVHLELISRAGSYMVNADPTRLQQVFMNLALNACDAMPEGGILRFDLDTICVNPGDTPPIPDLLPGEWIKIEVSDTGEGIPVDTLPHIFEPFYTTKPVGQGTGLGLAQVYGIVKQHNGFIDVVSQPGVWTTFKIFLPSKCAPVEEEQKLAEVFSRFDGGGQVVLLVEDDQPTREAIYTLLEVNNFKVLTAPNGMDALRMYARNNDTISLVVSDVVMPLMGGVELYKTLQAKWPNVKMLLVTGFPLDAEAQEILEKGYVNWLQKPFAIKDFMQAVQLLTSKVIR
jgi:PAS domain S-box-containing protein